MTTAAGPTLVGTTDRFTYTPPTVSSLSVTSGPVAGGTKVKITGSGLKGATSVHFGSVAATVVAINAKGTLVTVNAPPGAAGTVDVTVTTPEGTIGHRQRRPLHVPLGGPPTGRTHRPEE